MRISIPPPPRNRPLVVIGFDPGLGSTGWGLVALAGNSIRHMANGQVKTLASDPLAHRLAAIDAALADIMEEHKPDAAGVEEVFVNANPQTTLKLGQARGVVLLAAGRGGIAVGEYAPRLVKKAVVGTGTASKEQIHAMVSRLLPGVTIAGPDAADALAVALTHAHHIATANRAAAGGA